MYTSQSTGIYAWYDPQSEDLSDVLIPEIPAFEACPSRVGIIDDWITMWVYEVLHHQRLATCIHWSEL